MTTQVNTATLIKAHLPGYVGQANLYQMSPAYRNCLFIIVWQVDKHYVEVFSATSTGIAKRTIEDFRVGGATISSFFRHIHYLEVD